MPFLKEYKKQPRSRRLENLTKISGLRHAIFNIHGDKYIGNWQENKKTGKGMILKNTMDLYEGDFNKNYQHGFGVLAYQLESKIFSMEYRGNWRWGKMHGYGLRRYKDGGVYKGYWKKGKREGYGFMWYPNGEFYAGDFVEDKRHGLGMLVRLDSSRYEGQWANDMKQGWGKFFHLGTGQVQEGLWKEDMCIYCTFADLYYRQSALKPTKYGIHVLHLKRIPSARFSNEEESWESIPQNIDGSISSEATQ